MAEAPNPIPTASNPRVGEDWVLVPREPTIEMLSAGQRAADDKTWAWRGLGPRPDGTGIDGQTFFVRDAFHAMIASAPSPEAGAGGSWLPMKDAPTGVPIIAKHKPNAAMPHGWVATIKLGHGDDEEAGCYDTILHYNGEESFRGFRGMWTGWLPIGSALPSGAGGDLGELERHLGWTKVPTMAQLVRLKEEANIAHQNAGNIPQDAGLAALAQCADLDFRCAAIRYVEDLVASTGSEEETKGATPIGSGSHPSDRTPSGSAGSAVSILRASAEMALMYLRTGFLTCSRCSHEEPTEHLDAAYELNSVLSRTSAHDWQPIGEAPLDTEVEVRAGRMTFLAKLVPGAAMDTNEHVCDQWQATREGEHPPCWSDGCCWTVNEDERASLWPEAWRPVASCDRSPKGEDAEGGFVHEGAVAEGQTPEATPKSSPDQTPVDPQMTVEEAREVLKATNFFMRQFRQCVFGEWHGTPALPHIVTGISLGSQLDKESSRILAETTRLQAGGEVR